MFAIQIGFVVVAVIVVAVVSSGLTAAGVAWKDPSWQAPWQLEWIPVAVVAWFLRGFYCFVAATRFRGVKDELYALSFDPETIAARLKAIEVSTQSQLPTYVYTLLKRLDGAAQYAEG